MSTALKKIVSQMLPHAFERYKEASITENYANSGKDGFLLVAPEEIEEVNREFKITEFEQFAEYIANDLVYATT